MASLIIQRVLAAGVAGASAASSASVNSADSGPAGAVSVLCFLDSGRSLRRSQCALSSSQSFSQCRVLFPAACSSLGKQQSRPQGTVCMVLPTGNPVKEGQGTGAQGHPAWSARAIKSFSMAELEARKMKYPTTGTESLLMGILTEGTSDAAKFLRANGVTLFGVRDETIKVLGKADMYFFSPEHPPLTEQALKALDWAIEEQKRRGGGAEVKTSLMLLGIWAQKGSAGQKVLEALGFDDKKSEELLASERAPTSVN